MALVNKEENNYGVVIYQEISAELLFTQNNLCGVFQQGYSSPILAISNADWGHK